MTRLDLGVAQRAEHLGRALLARAAAGGWRPSGAGQRPVGAPWFGLDRRVGRRPSVGAPCYATLLGAQPPPRSERRSMRRRHQLRRSPASCAAMRDLSPAGGRRARRSRRLDGARRRRGRRRAAPGDRRARSSRVVLVGRPAIVQVAVGPARARPGARAGGSSLRRRLLRAGGSRTAGPRPTRSSVPTVWSMAMSCLARSALGRLSSCLLGGVGGGGVERHRVSTATCRRGWRRCRRRPDQALDGRAGRRPWRRRRAGRRRSGG